MNYKVILTLGVSGIGVSIILLLLSFSVSSILLMILGIILIVVSILTMMILLSLDMFLKDKKLDIEELKRLGLTIVECDSCGQTNVLEDQFCVRCGEKLHG